MNKTALLAGIVAKLEQDHDLLMRAVQTARDAATHEQSKAENKYDTRGLEASYLAHGQARRLQEIAQALARYRALKVQPHDPEIGIRTGDMLNLRADDGSSRNLFLGPDAAGLRLELGGQAWLVITLQAPLGQALRGLGEGDEVTLSLEGGAKGYAIVAVQ
ncbi:MULTISPECIES: GreA/GreB family elongation factor [unclassified Pseudomonas]|uniref:GreA/GreB family elongation factor n=1 Tax=unclassified Pseudomonas TaxID=196821 RepID=UPI000BDD6C1E|nr:MULTISPECIES: GreA/GreB family elongation factor [unclassified Pseudomonas]PVZ09216.1 GreA/GreB family transcription elongation factor [Pseudomonas sp. URIL14HWK12:I12]PVZ21339.1 GreA/GreB family transcription elongation factor [Pseudomonas sp. URIL14HWK12:I10]PVZ30192.1 GreA/GreB family transcription elongation factor [Pseudomonas sp. URIL14HWK12:I11]SNZ18728.1 GreA/GreB family elongation factor [Pseudomonas sp. URIL14HWK12:I9]